MADQPVHAVVQLDGPGFPGKLHPLPAGALDGVALDEHMLGEHARDAADPGVPDHAVPDHAVPHDFPWGMRMVPALVPHVHRDPVGPVHRAVLDDPVMAPVGGNRAALRHRRAGGGVHAGEALYPDIAQELLVRGEALLPHGDLDPVIFRVLVPGKAEMDLHPVGFHPVGVVLPGHAVVQRHLPERLSVAEHAAPPVQVGGHVRLIILDKQAVVQDVHRAERVIAPKQIRVQVVFKDADFVRLRRAHPKGPSLAGREIPDLFRRADHDRPVPESLVGNHALRAFSAPLRAYALPVQAGMDPHPGAGASFPGRPADGPKRRCLTAVIVVGSGRVRAVHKELPVKDLLPLPEVKASAVRQQGRKILRDHPPRPP